MTPSPAPPHCDTELSLGVLRIRAACIRRTGDIYTADPLVSTRPRAAGTSYAIGLNGITLVTHDPRATG